jgi:hypothetical protein
MCDWSRWVITGKYNIAPLWRLMYPKNNQRPPPKAELTKPEAEAAQKAIEVARAETSSPKLWQALAASFGSEAVKESQRWNPLEERTVDEAFTRTLQWWSKNGLERNMVPTYLDGAACHRGVWKAQGVDTSEAGQLKMDASSLTEGGELVFTSDACTDADGTGRPAMGAFCGVESYFIDSLETTLPTDEHIGYWEFLAGHEGITKRWAEKFRGKRVLWRCDNTIAIAAINKGYSGLKIVDDMLPALGEKLWELSINPYAIHIPGVWNGKADAISRRRLKPTTCEYLMKDTVYNEICASLTNRIGIVTPFTAHTRDGYASVENTKYTRFNSEVNPFEFQTLENDDVWLSCDYNNVTPGPAPSHLLDQRGCTPRSELPWPYQTAQPPNATKRANQIR